MRALRHLSFALRSAWQSFSRNATAASAAVISITLVLILAGINLIIGHSFEQVFSGYRQRISVITINIADGTPLPAVAAFEATLRARPEVASVRFESKAQVLQQLASDPREQQLLEQIQGNPVPAKLEVHLHNLTSVGKIDALARSWVGVDPSEPTDYEGDLVNNVLRLSNWLTAAGLGLLAILIVVSVVIVMNTIRTSIYHRRHEIEVMRLVGAAGWFVRGPFLLEGVLTGLVSAGLAIGVLAAVYHPLVTRFKGDLFFIPLTYDPTFVTTLGIDLLLSGALLGAVGSYIGARRYVKL